MAEGTFLFNDNFDKPITAGFPFFRKWRNVAGSWQVSKENEHGILIGKPAESTEAMVVAGNANWTNYALDVNVKFLSESIGPPEGGIILYLRYQNNKNFLSVHFPIFKKTIELWQRRQGDWSLLGIPLNFPFLLNQWYHFRIEAHQLVIRCYVDGAFIYSWDIQDFSKGGIGLGVKLCQASFAKLKVEELFGEPQVFSAVR